MKNSFHKGEIASLKVELRAAELGYYVSKPTVPVRYDIILEKNGKLWRCQIKYCDYHDKKRSKSSLKLKLGGSKRHTSYSKDEIDILLVYIPKIEDIFWIPVDRIHKKNDISLAFKESTRKIGIEREKLRIKSSEFSWKK